MVQNAKKLQQERKQKRLQELDAKKQKKQEKKDIVDATYAKTKLNEMKEKMAEIDPPNASKLFGFDDVDMDDLNNKWVF